MLRIGARSEIAGLTIARARGSEGHMAQITVVAVTSAAQMKLAHAIRRAVFIEEQHVPEDIELDAADADNPRSPDKVWMSPPFPHCAER